MIHMGDIASEGDLCPARRLRRTFRIAVAEGFPDAIDQLAEASHSELAFLRRQWFVAAAPEGGKTLLAEAPDGTAKLAIPLARRGPPVLGLGAVPGVYWPFRSALYSPHASTSELAAILAHPESRVALGPVWRMGPVYARERTTRALVLAARKAGWEVLTRNLGTSFVLDLTQDGWPRASTCKRLRRYHRKLDQLGQVTIERVTGAGWNPGAFAQLERIERSSWVGLSTDLSGAKFANAKTRAMWERAVVDPALAHALSATILRLDERPIAFSFDLRAGTRQYAIASSYDEEFTDLRTGQIVTQSQLLTAREEGIETVDFGAGDSGYKREIGAKPATEIHDYLFVRSKAVAALLRIKWETGEVSSPGTGQPGEAWDEELIAAAADDRTFSNLERILMAGGIAAATVAMME